MNEKKLLSYLENYHKWLKSNKTKATEELAERAELANAIKSYDKEKILSFTNEDFYALLSPLWAMGMWGNKQHRIDSIIEKNGLPLLREQFANLMFGSASIAKRWDEFRDKISLIGPGIMSEILSKTYPDKCLLWNRVTKNGFVFFEIEKTPKYDSAMDGAMYDHLSKCGQKMLEFANKHGYKGLENLIALDYFIWHELKKVVVTEETEIEIPKNKKEQTFVHNDIRDKIKAIGDSLGFDAKTEQFIAPGSRVDAVWEVSIGNMGRIIYVFEVQAKGSIDSLLVNLMKAKTNKAVQGIVAVSDSETIEEIKQKVGLLEISKDVRYWDYKEVIEVYEALNTAYESINKLKLVPESFIK